MISAVFVRPSAGLGVVEVQKFEVSCDFYGARATLCGDRRGRGAKIRVCFCDFCGARAILCGDRRSRGAKFGFFLRSRACSRNRRVTGSIPPWSTGVVRCNLRRPTCTDQFSALPRATYAEQFI